MLFYVPFAIWIVDAIVLTVLEPLPDNIDHGESVSNGKKDHNFSNTCPCFCDIERELPLAIFRENVLRNIL